MLTPDFQGAQAFIDRLEPDGSVADPTTHEKNMCYRCYLCCGRCSKAYNALPCVFCYSFISFPEPPRCSLDTFQSNQQQFEMQQVLTVSWHSMGQVLNWSPYSIAWVVFFSIRLYEAAGTDCQPILSSYIAPFLASFKQLDHVKADHRSCRKEAMSFEVPYNMCRMHPTITQSLHWYIIHNY